jgi:hypothetical protein
MPEAPEERGSQHGLHAHCQDLVVLCSSTATQRSPQKPVLTEKVGKVVSVGRRSSEAGLGSIRSLLLSEARPPGRGFEGGGAAGH